MEPQLIRKRKGRKGWGTVLCLGLPYRASPWNLPTSTQSLDLSASGVFGFQLHPLSFTNILRARTLKKNQLFNFESQALYRERPISASIGKKMELGNGLAGCYHLRSGRSAFCEVWARAQLGSPPLPPPGADTRPVPPGGSLECNPEIPAFPGEEN